MKNILRDKKGKLLKGSAPLVQIKYPKKVGVCLICSNDIVAKSTAFAKNRKFCSVNCSVKSKIGVPRPDKRITLICLYCSTTLKEYKSRNKKFCSPSCYFSYNCGSNHFMWKEAINPGAEERKKLMKRKTYQLWRKAVFDRDNWTCLWCGLEDKERVGKGIIVQADHIKSWRNYPELRFAIDNGRTLCVKCHKKTETNGIFKKKIISAEV